MTDTDLWALRDLADVRFVMIGADATGGGERPWAQALLERARSLPNLEYLGARSQAQVNQLLARAHVFVNTSRYEGFPNTFIQAWMREVPVVSLHVDPDRLLETQQVGIFCGGEEARLAQAVRNLLTDSALRSRYAARLSTNAIAPTRIRLTAQDVSRLNQLRDTNLRPR